MKITKAQLKQIIKEEIEKSMEESAYRKGNLYRGRGKDYGSIYSAMLHDSPEVKRRKAELRHVKDGIRRTERSVLAFTNMYNDADNDRDRAFYKKQLDSYQEMLDTYRRDLSRLKGQDLGVDPEDLGVSDQYVTMRHIRKRE